MKLSSNHFVRLLVAASASIFFMFTGPATSWADRDDHDKKNKKKHDSDWGRRDNDRRVYFSRPRSSFSLSFGSGYAGPGYYYGPPGAPYYYEAPGVVYYRTRAAVPSRYYVRESYGIGSTDAAVQRALARRGYYHGPIDGDIGPGSRRAIANFQADRGLRVTGTITSSLLRELGIY